MKIKEIYICSGVYHLFQSVYFAQKSDNEKILIYLNTIEENIPVDLFAEYFDRIIYEETYVNDNFALKTFKRCLHSGWLFPLSKAGRECYDRAAKYRTYVFNDYQMEANRIIQAVKKRKESIILVEEGLMTYSTNQYWLSYKRHRIYDFLTGVFIKGAVEHNHAIDTIMCKQPDKLPAEKAKGRKVVRIENMYLDREWTDQMVDLLEINEVSFSSNAVLWLGQPLVECGLEEADEINFIRSLAEMLGSEYELVIKKHPRDRAEKYDPLNTVPNISVLEMGEQFWIPAELLFIKLKPSMVFTSFSSAADFMIERADYPFKVVYCAGLMGIGLDENSKDALSGEHRFLVETRDELKDILNDDIYS